MYMVSEVVLVPELWVTMMMNTWSKEGANGRTYDQQRCPCQCRLRKEEMKLESCRWEGLSLPG